MKLFFRFCSRFPAEGWSTVAHSWKAGRVEILVMWRDLRNDFPASEENENLGAKMIFRYDRWSRSLFRVFDRVNQLDTILIEAQKGARRSF
jgi:hypothetical protein